MNTPRSFPSIEHDMFADITRILFAVAANAVTLKDQQDAKQILGEIKGVVNQMQPGAKCKPMVRPSLTPIRHTKKKGRK